MIEQTALEVFTWKYQEPANMVFDESKLTSNLEFHVQKRRNSEKKGLACRFSCVFMLDGHMLLEYVAGDTYVVDFEDVVDYNELMTMVRNSFEKFKQTFDLRKLLTILNTKTLTPFNDRAYDWEPVLELLK